MAVFALVHGANGGDRRAAIERARRRLEPRAGAGSRRVEGAEATLWVGASLAVEALPDGDPLAEGDGHVVVFDGVLRERARHARELGLPADAAPARIVLELLHRRGSAALSALRGGFAVAAWSPAGLLLARDLTGARPLFLRRDGARTIAASSERAVLDAAAAAAIPEPTAIAAHLAWQAPPPGTCFLAGVEEVPPGCVVVVRDARSTVEDLGARLGLARHAGPDDAVVAAWRDVLAAAVADACTDGLRPAVSLSGGLDSSTIAALVPRGTPAVGWRLPGVPAADESTWIDAVAAHAGLPRIDVDGSDRLPLAAGEPWPLHADTPLSNPYRLLKAAQWRAARAAGVDVLLSGNFGDHVYPSERAWLLDALRRGRFRVAASEWRARARGRAPWREPGLRALARHVLGLGRARPVGPPAWLGPRARAAWQPPGDWPRWADRAADPARCRVLLGLEAAQHAAQETPFADAAGLRLAHPWRDERVIDLALSLPPDRFDRAGLPKALTREALAGLLPDAVRLRPKSGSLTPFFRAGLRGAARPVVDAVLADPRREWPQWLDERQVAQAAATDQPDDRADLLLWAALSLELWFRELRGGPCVLASAP
jgi:asparagine synthase (glutamine-hydrolysing)